MQSLSERIVSRPQYIELLKKWQRQSDLIKIITGVRRCGKSKLFYLYQQYLISDNIPDEIKIIKNSTDTCVSVLLYRSFAKNGR